MDIISALASKRPFTKQQAPRILNAKVIDAIDLDPEMSLNRGNRFLAKPRVTDSPVTMVSAVV